MGKKDKFNKTRQNFLLTFFNENQYEEVEVNGYWLVKQFNSTTDNWQVLIMDKNAFEKYNNFKKYPMLYANQKEHIKELWNN